MDKRSSHNKQNTLTKSLGLPNSSTKDGSVGDKSGRSGGGILGLSGINLDFRKSKDGLKSFFKQSSNKPAEKGAGVVSSSIEFSQMQKR
jgi:hypothetical protein